MTLQVGWNLSKNATDFLPDIFDKKVTSQKITEVRLPIMTAKNMRRI